MEQESKILQEKITEQERDEKNILDDYKVEEVTLGGAVYYRLDKHFTFPSGKGEKLFIKSMCKDGLESYIRQLIEQDKKNTAEIEKLKIKKQKESEQTAEAEKQLELEKNQERKKISNILIELRDGEEYRESIPFDPKEIGSNKDYISFVIKHGDKVFARCCTSGTTFGHSKSGYYSDEEIDITDFLKKEAEK